MAKRPAVKHLKGTPLRDGFRFPAEWERQSGTWFSWPRPEGISFPGKYHTIPTNIAAIIREIGKRQLVHINVPNENYRRIVREQLTEAGVPKVWFVGKRPRVNFHDIPTNESWCRDHGPAFVVRTRNGKKQKAIVDWGFNAWGGKYPPFDADDAVPVRIAEAWGSKIVGVYSPLHPRAGGEAVGKLRRIVMEGGAVEFNGRGTVLTTESCLLNPNRNPGMSKWEIEKALKEYYGQTHVCWLGDGIVGDDTDGHIDDLARFLDPRTIAVAVENDRRDGNYHILGENLDRTLKLRDQDGKPFRVVTLPMPGVVEFDGQRLPATYLNFLFVNGACLVPTFRHRTNDRLALRTLQEHLPKHEVVGIDCVELIWGLGAIHCLTQQEP